ncbi:MAG: hypothetical protein HY320_13660 [Armatimonadetes bacterium]|nr:hypothetical protein [Armatimonadota bacterium]
MRVFYPAPPDRFIFWVTWLYWVFVVLALVTVLSAPLPRAVASAGAVSLAVVLIGMGLVCWGLQPRIYAVSPEAVVIQRRAFFPPVRLSVASITAARAVELPWLIARLWGVAGCYSNTGWFWSPEMGIFWMSSTNGHHLVLLEGTRRVVISPEDRQGFLTAVDEVRRGIVRAEDDLETEP